MNGEDEGGL